MLRERMLREPALDLEKAIPASFDPEETLKNNGDVRNRKYIHNSLKEIKGIITNMTRQEDKWPALGEPM